MVICPEQGSDLHMAQLMPLPLTVSCFSEIRIGFTSLVPAHTGSPGKGPLNGCVCVYRSNHIYIPPGSLNRVPATAAVKAGMSPLPSGR